MQLSLNRSVRAIRAWGASLAGYGLLTFKLPIDKEISKFSGLPSWLTEDNIQAVGWLALAAGLILWLLSWWGNFVAWASGVGREALINVTFGDAKIELRMLKISDLPSIYEVFKLTYGDDLISQTVVEAWMRKNPMIAYEVLRQPKKAGKTLERIGYFEMLPLTKAGAKKLRGDNPQTADLVSADIHSGVKWAMADVYYIASVGVVEPENLKRAKLRSLAKAHYEGAIMKLLKERLCFLSARRSIEVLAKPVTDPGLKLVKSKKYHFKKLQSHLPDRQAIWSSQVSVRELEAESEEATS